MKAVFHLSHTAITADISRPIDISLPIAKGEGHANAWYVPPVEIEPVRSGSFTGSVKEGGSVNFRDIRFNPHGHGTHTECVGHISPEVFSINEHLKEYFFDALLVSVQPEKITSGKTEDQIITLKQLQQAIGDHRPKAVIIRTLPNEENKRSMSWSNTNPPYLDHEAAEYLSSIHVDHLLIDLPSVDREDDNGALLAHRAFWQYPHNTQYQRTITEFVFIDNSVADGAYLLNLMVSSFENDAAPSKPVLYPII